MTAYLYIIGGTDKPYKLGITKDPTKRLKALQTGNPIPLTIHHLEPVPHTQVKHLETELHSMLSHKRLKGEWFDISLSEAKDFVTFTRIKFLKED